MTESNNKTNTSGSRDATTETQGQNENEHLESDNKNVDNENKNEHPAVENNEGTNAVVTDIEDMESNVQTAPVSSIQDTECVSPCHIDVCIEPKIPECEDHLVAGSRGGLVNTPASFFTDLSEYKAG